MVPSIVIHHGGAWCAGKPISYVGGQVTTLDSLPLDIDSRYIRKTVDSLGHKDVIKMHYLDPRKSLETGLRYLGSDEKTFDHLIGFLFDFDEVHIYSEHDESAENLNVVDLTLEGSKWENFSFTDLLNCDVGEIVENEAHAHVSKVGNYIKESGVASEVVEPIGRDGNYKLNMTDPLLDYNSYGSDNEDDEVVTAREKLKKDKIAQQKYEDEMESLKRLTTWSREGVIDADTNCGSSTDLDSSDEKTDEEECGYLVCPETLKRTRKSNLSYRAGTKPHNTVFFKGQTFNNAEQLKNAISDYCASQGKDVRYTKNHCNRIGARCKGEGCPWKIWASWSGKSTTFQVMTYIGEHRCGRLQKVKKISTNWIANHYQSKFKLNPYVKLQEIIDTIWSDWGLRTTMWMTSKARRKAQQLVVGEYKEQYNLLNRYAAEILKANPNNTVKFGLEANIFKRMYICFEALRFGFVNGCKPFISIDRCFLKGPFGGQLLAAVAGDGNNQMFPIAWALVDVENEDSWSWFLGLLGLDMGTIDGVVYTIMSDQQKGLLNAIANVWPSAEQRCCARHVYCNFREVFGGGQDFRRGFWRIAKSTTKNEFNENVAKFRELFNAASDDILKRNYKRWCRAFYTSQSMCDNIDNNMSEIYNDYILSFRHKPIITMLDEIALSIMDRMHKKRDYMVNRDLFLCPRIQQKVEKAKYEARGWSAYWDGQFKFAVREGVSQIKYVVDLLNRTCSCNVWQLNRIPCHHAVAAIWMHKGEPEHYVAKCYYKVGFLKAYQWSMTPLNGPLEWPQSSFEPILPPSVKALKAGRPKTKRRLQAGEVTSGAKLSKHGARLRCSRCNNEGNMENIKMAREQLHLIQAELAHKHFDSKLIKEEKEVRIRIEKLARIEESSIRQKSRDSWLKLGDDNTYFFHASLRTKKAHNAVMSILNEQM